MYLCNFLIRNDNHSTTDTKKVYGENHLPLSYVPQPPSFPPQKSPWLLASYPSRHNLFTPKSFFSPCTHIIQNLEVELSQGHLPVALGSGWY